MTDHLSMFDELVVDTSITTEDLDEAVRKFDDAKREYETAKKVSNDAHADMIFLQEQMITLLKAAKKSKYIVDGVGTVTVTEKLKVKTPQNPLDKEKFFNWLKERHGADGFLASAGVNYQTLNRIYNEAFEEAKDNGTAADFSIPGIATPESETGISFRRKK